MVQLNTDKYSRGMTNKQKVQFGKLLMDQRLSIGYTRIQMSEALCVDRTSYSRWERGMHVPQANVDELKQDVSRVVSYVKSKQNGVAVS